MVWVLRSVITVFLLVIIYFGVVFYISYSKLNKVSTSRLFPGDDNPGKHGLSYEKVTFKSTDGSKLAGWLMPAEKPKGMILFLHGFGVAKGGANTEEKFVGGKSGSIPYYEFLVKGGYSVLAFDFRLQGESEGEKITFGKDERKDMAGAVNFIKSREDLKNLPRGLMGLSFGGAMAFLYPDFNDFKAVVSAAAYADFGLQLDEEVRSSPYKNLPLIRQISKLAARFVFGTSLDKISPKNFAANISPRPVLISHGEKDTRFSREHPKLLFENAKEPKTLIIVPGANHTIVSEETPEQSKEEYKKLVLEFFAKNL